MEQIIYEENEPNATEKKPPIDLVTLYISPCKHESGKRDSRVSVVYALQRLQDHQSKRAQSLCSSVVVVV